MFKLFNQLKVQLSLTLLMLASGSLLFSHNLSVHGNMRRKCKEIAAVFKILLFVYSSMQWSLIKVMQISKLQWTPLPNTVKI